MPRISVVLLDYRYNIGLNPVTNTENQAIRYLQHSVTEFGNTDPVIHNYLLSLYASEASQQDLLQFLRAEPKHYDLKHALRLCIRMQKIEAAIQVTKIHTSHHPDELVGLYEGLLSMRS